MTNIHNKDLYDLALKHFNEPILAGGHEHVCRLIGYGETGVDCYFICREYGTSYEQGETFWQTCVGGWFWLDRLKGQGYVKSTKGEDWDDFVRLDTYLSLNGCPKEKDFMLVLNHDDMEGLRSIAT